MNNLRNRFRLLGSRGNGNNQTAASNRNSSDHSASDNNTVYISNTSLNNSNSLAPNASDHTIGTARTNAGRESVQSTHTRRLRQLGCHKICCGGFCLRVGPDACCRHASRSPQEEGQDDEDALCSFCYDRRREERRTRHHLETQRLRLWTPEEPSAVSSSPLVVGDVADNETHDPQNGILKTCCGVPCLGPSYTSCCAHNDVTFYANNGSYAGAHGLAPNLESYCSLCRDRYALRGNMIEALSPPNDQEDDSSVGAVRTMPTPAGRKASEPLPLQDWDGGMDDSARTGITEKLQQLEDADLQECVTKCLSSIECPVCLESFGADPVTLPCGHSMCLHHIYNMDRCPICRWVLPNNWKAFAQPSIALRESAAAVQEAVALLVSLHQPRPQLVCEPCHQWTPPETPRKGETMSSSTSTTSECSEGEGVPSSMTKCKPKLVGVGVSVDC